MVLVKLVELIGFDIKWKWRSVNGDSRRVVGGFLQKFYRCCKLEKYVLGRGKGQVLYSICEEYVFKVKYFLEFLKLVSEGEF